MFCAAVPTKKGRSWAPPLRVAAERHPACSELDAEIQLDLPVPHIVRGAGGVAEPRTLDPDIRPIAGGSHGGAGRHTGGVAIHVPGGLLDVVQDIEGGEFDEVAQAGGGAGLGPELAVPLGGEVQGVGVIEAPESPGTAVVAGVGLPGGIDVDVCGVGEVCRSREAVGVPAGVVEVEPEGQRVVADGAVALEVCVRSSLAHLAVVPCIHRLRAHRDLGGVVTSNVTAIPMNDYWRQI